MTKGKTLTLRNAKIEMYRGCVRLVVDKWGLVEEASEDLDIQPKVSSERKIIRIHFGRVFTFPCPWKGKRLIKDWLILFFLFPLLLPGGQQPVRSRVRASHHSMRSSYHFLPFLGWGAAMPPDESVFVFLHYFIYFEKEREERTKNAESGRREERTTPEDRRKDKYSMCRQFYIIPLFFFSASSSS